METVSTADKEIRVSREKADQRSVEQTKQRQESLRAHAALIATIAVTLFGLTYLTLSITGLIGANKLGTTEVLIFAALLFFNSVLIGRLDSLSISGKGIDFKVREVQKEQNRQRDEIKSIQFLLRYFVTQSELNRLQELSDGSSPYHFSNDYEKKGLHNELRRLRSLDLIRMVSGKTIGGDKDGINDARGDLFSYVRLTDRGREYLELRKAIET
jgi:hypothetical protein